MADRAQVRQLGSRRQQQQRSKRHLRHFRQLDNSTFCHQTSYPTSRRFVARQLGRQYSLPSRRGTRTEQQSTEKTIINEQTG